MHICVYVQEWVRAHEVNIFYSHKFTLHEHKTSETSDKTNLNTVKPQFYIFVRDHLNMK